MSAQAERGIVAAILFDEASFLKAVECGIRPEWFSDTEALAIFDWMRQRFSESKGIDLLSYAHGRVVPQWLDEAYQRALIANVPSYVADMRDSWLRVQALNIQAEFRDALKGDGDPTELIVAASERLRRLMDAEEGNNEALSVIAERLVADWQEPISARQKGIPWPLQQLEASLGKVTDELVYIVAAPSVGKTAFILQWLVSLAWAARTSALRTIESPKRQLVARMISQLGRCNTWRLRKGKALPDDSDFEGATNAVVALKRIERGIHISDAPASMEQLNAWAQIEKAKGSEILFIDNMKHIRPDAGRKYSSPVEQFRDMSQRLKWLRDDVQLPIVVLHHTNKDGDASWSSDIERDVDTLVMMTLDANKTIPASHDNRWCGTSVVNFEVRKQRDGARGFIVPCSLDCGTQTWKDERDDGLEPEEFQP